MSMALENLRVQLGDRARNTGLQAAKPKLNSSSSIAKIWIPTWSERMNTIFLARTSEQGGGERRVELNCSISFLFVFYRSDV